MSVVLARVESHEVEGRCGLRTGLCLTLSGLAMVMYCLVRELRAHVRQPRFMHSSMVIGTDRQVGADDRQPKADDGEKRAGCLQAIVMANLNNQELN